MTGDRAPGRIAFLGFGLIAGSIARALRSSEAVGWRDARLTAWSPGGAGPRHAQQEGLLDVAAADPASAIRGADLVILAAPPLPLIELVARLGGDLRPHLAGNAVVTDVASTKSAVLAAAERAGLRFVGGHPMAGREVTGYGASLPDLFVGRPWVVIPAAGAGPGDRVMVEGLARACGARPLALSARDHDAATAGISHLPLVTAAALVEAVAGTGEAPAPGWATASELASSGWRDMTRLARGDVAMGAGIAVTNADALAERIRALRDVLDAWLAELEHDGGPDPGRLEARLAAARRRLETEASGS